MATSTFFNNVGASNEQELLQDLIVESIKIYGIDMIYLPRIRETEDAIFGQSDISTFRQTFYIELYVKTYDGFEGEGNLFSKFGVEIRDQITFTVAKRTFDNLIGRETDFIRPREGDLIYYPLNQKAFEIKYIQNKPIHYPLGILPTFDMYCELYEYSNEHFDTGIPEIDEINAKFSTNIYDYGILTDLRQPIKTDQGHIIVRSPYKYQDAAEPDDNATLTDNVSDIIDFSESDPFGEIEH